MQVATGSFGYGYSPLNLLDSISFLVEACAKVNELVKEDMAEVEVTEEDTVDRRNWRKKIRCGDP